MPLSFKGTAHPPASRNGHRANLGDLSRAELATTQLGKGGQGTPLLREHAWSDPVGTVHASWEGPDGSLRVRGTVSEPSAIAAMRAGAMRGLSLGTAMTSGSEGSVLMRQQEELSMCVEPRRAGCYVDEIDGRSVRTVECYSNKNRESPPLTLDKAHLPPGPTDPALPRPHCKHAMTDAAASETVPQPMDTGVSMETFKASQAEAEKLRAALAAAQAKNDVYDQAKREELKEIKGFLVPSIEEDIMKNEALKPFAQQHMLASKYYAKMDECPAEALDQTLSNARLTESYAKELKRTRELASQTADSASLLAASEKKCEEVTLERDAKAQRVVELEGLVAERTQAAEAFQNELARNNLISEKQNFSNQAARENTGGAASSSADIKPPVAVVNVAADPLFDFMRSTASNGGLKIMQSGTGHHHLGAMAGSSGSDGITEAMRGY